MKLEIAQNTYTKGLEEILCLDIDLELSALGAGNIESRNLWNVLILTFSLLFLELEGDTTDGSTLNTLHQVGGVTGNLLYQLLDIRRLPFPFD